MQGRNLGDMFGRHVCIFQGNPYPPQKAVTRRPRPLLHRVAAVLGAVSLSFAGAMLPAAPSQADTSGLTITKQGGLYQGGKCVMGQGLDAAGYMWAAPGTAICYEYVIHNSSSTAASSVSFSDGFQGTWANGQPALTNASTPTVTGDGTNPQCSGSSASNYYNCSVSSLPGGGTMTVLIHGIINPGLPSSTPAAQCEGKTGTQIANQAGVIADWGYGLGKWVCGNNTWIINTASLTAQGGVPILVQNASQAIAVGGTTTPEVDVQLTKCVGAGSIPAGTCPTSNAVNPGQVVLWQVTATNFGPADAQNVVVTDTVPAGVTITSAVNCQPPAGVTLPAPGPFTLTCSTSNSGGFQLQANAMAGEPGQSQPFTISGIVDSDFTGTLTNTASSTNVTNPRTDDPTPDNNTNITTETTVPANLEYGLYIHKHADRQKLPADDGIPVQYTIHAGNAMGGTAHDVTITDTLPAGLEFTNPPFAITQGDPSNVSCSVTGQTLTCQVASLLVGTANEVVLQLNTQSTVNLAEIGAPVINTASINADCPEGQTDCGTNHATTDWPLSQAPAADAYIHKSINGVATGATVMGGGTAELTFNVGVKLGSADEEGVSAVAPLVTDQLPEGMTFIAKTDGGGATIGAAIDANGNAIPTTKAYELVNGDCTMNPVSLGITNSTLPSNTLYCLLDQNMAQGDQVNINVPVQIGDLPGGSQLINQAYVQNTSDGFEPGNPNSGSMTHVNLGNNVDVSTASVFAEVNLKAGLGYGPYDSSGNTCDGTRTPTDYDGPGSSRLVTVDITNNGNVTTPYPGFNLQRSTGAEPNFAAMEVTPGTLSYAADGTETFTPTGDPVSAQSIGGQCIISSMSIACGFPNSSVAPGQTFRITYPITLLPSDTPNTDPESDLTVWNGAWIPDADWDDNLTSNNISIGSAVSNICITKTPYDPVPNPAFSDVNTDTHAAFWQDGYFGYKIRLSPPAGGVSADTANGVVTDLLPVGFYPLDASADAGTCDISGPVGPEAGANYNVSTDANGATATGPRYQITCPIMPGGGNAPGGTDPVATVNVWATILPNTVNAYHTENLGNGINWAEQVPNTASFNYNAIGAPTTDDQTVTASTSVDLIQQVPMFSITKTPSTTYSDPNAPVSWTITVTNTGPVGATNPVITDTFNDGSQVTLTGATVVDSHLADNANCPGDVLPCRADALAVGGTITVQVTGTIADLPGSTEVNNTALVQSDTPGSAKAAARITVLPVADLWVVKSAPATAQPGAGLEPDSPQMTWEILAANYGPTTVPDAVVTDQIPGGVTVTSATWPIGTTTADDGSTVTTYGHCTATVPATAENDPDGDPAVDLVVPVALPAAGPLTLSCPVGALALGDPAVPITINANIDKTFTGELPNTASIAGATSNIPELTADNGGHPNTWTTTTTVNPEADLWLRKTAPTEAVTPGQSIKWLLKTGNYGPSTVPDAVVHDAIPAGAIVTSASWPGGSCTAATDPDGDMTTPDGEALDLPAAGPFTLTCAVGTLADGDEVDITVDGVVDPAFTGTNLHNSALITSPTVPQVPTTDPGGTPNGDDSDTPIGNPDSSLWISKKGPEPAAEGAAPTVIAGNQIAWVITVGNHGPSVAKDVVVTDPVPTGVTDVTVPDNCSAAVDDEGRTTLTCAVGDLAPGASVEIPVTGTVSPSVGDDTLLDNRAIATSPTQPNSPQVSDPYPIIVERKATLVLQKTATETAMLGDQITYYLNLANSGPSDVSDAHITDTLPEGLVDGMVTQGPCGEQSVADLPSCLIALKVNENTPLTIVATLAANSGLQPGTELPNSADAVSSVSEPAYAHASTLVVAEPGGGDGETTTPPEGGDGGETTTPPEGGGETTPPEGGDGGETPTPPSGGGDGGETPTPPAPVAPGTPPERPIPPGGSVPAPPTTVAPPAVPAPPAPLDPATPAVPSAPNQVPQVPWTPAPPAPTVPEVVIPTPVALDISGRNPVADIVIPRPTARLVRSATAPMLTATGVMFNGWLMAGITAIVAGVTLTITPKRRPTR